MNISIQNYKNKKNNLWRSFVTAIYFLFTSVILLQFVCLKKYLNNFKQLFLFIIAQIVVKFQMTHDRTPGYQNCKIELGQESKIADVTKNREKKINFFSRTIKYNWL